MMRYGVLRVQRYGLLLRMAGYSSSLFPANGQKNPTCAGETDLKAPQNRPVFFTTENTEGTEIHGEVDYL